MTTRRGLGVAAAVLALTGCGAVDVAPARPGTTTSAPATTSTASPGVAPGQVVLRPQLRRDLERVLRDHPEDEAAVALTAVGSQERPATTGRPVTLVGWSTTKVPLALAALRRSPRSPALTGDVHQAITVSDNAAALRLWAGLGPPTTASAAVEDVLGDAGDRRTQVPATTSIPGVSPFGQARWRLVDQARFTAGLPCLPGSRAVTAEMGRVVPDQRWGLGRVPGAQVKGGWGPTTGGYVLRQLAVLPSGTAVTLQIRTKGDHAHATEVADAIGRVVRDHGADLPTGRCR